MNDLEHEILFLRQALVAQRVRATLPAPRPRPAFMAVRLSVPASNGKRGTERQVAIAALPLAPDSKLTTFGKISQEGIVKRKIAENEAEIARLRAELSANNR